MEIVRDELTPAGSRFRLPSAAQIVTVTPEMASDWLSYRNHPKNRPLSKSVSARYQADMESGRWAEATPEGYIFDTDGWIISFVAIITSCNRSCSESNRPSRC